MFGILQSNVAFHLQSCPQMYHYHCPQIEAAIAIAIMSHNAILHETPTPNTSYKILDSFVDRTRLRPSQLMRGSRKFCQRGSNFDNFFSRWGEWGSKYHYKRVIIGWRADDGPTLNAGLVALRFSGLRNPIFLSFFRGGGPDPLFRPLLDPRMPNCLGRAQYQVCHWPLPVGFVEMLNASKN